MAGRPRARRFASGARGDLFATHVADTFLRVLAWWATRGAPCPARDADRLFRALVAPAVAEAVT